MNDIINEASLVLNMTTAAIFWMIIASVGGVGLFALSRFTFIAIERVRKVKVYDRDGVSRRKFSRHDMRILFERGRVAHSGNRWSFFGDNTADDARKDLKELADRREEIRLLDYERRPRWNWEISESPAYETAMKISDRIFKFFQWIIVAVGIGVLGQRTGDITITVAGLILLMTATTPYVIFLSEFVIERLSITPGSGGRYMIWRLGLVTSLLLGTSAVLIQYVIHLADVLSATPIGG